MTRLIEELAPPRQRQDARLIRSGRAGTYWQAEDGLIVRLSGAESAVEAERAQRELFELACREARGE
jgi:hypothetical protein